MATPPASVHHPHTSPPLPPSRHRSPPPDGGAYWNDTQAPKSLPMILPIFILFFILVTFLSIFLFRDILQYLSTTWFSRRRRRGASPAGGQAEQGTPAEGLDPAILASFPTLPYSAVRGLQEGKCGRECAVCLSEFAAGDVIRLLTVCCHAFHPMCIDSWLAGHKTCPMCRSDLQGPPDEAAVMVMKEAVRVGGQSYAISIDEEEETAKLHSQGGSGRGREEAAGDGRSTTSRSESFDEPRASGGATTRHSSSGSR